MLTYLIDDDGISLYLTKQVLRMEAFATDVQEFLSGPAALDDLLPRLAGAAELPRVVFLDLNMPVMSGWDFLDALAPHAAALQGRCSIFLLTSSLALSDTARAAGNALVAGIVHKPLDADELRAIGGRIQQNAVSE